MILLDTHVIVYDVLEPRRLSRRARTLIKDGSESGALACSDISLWEIAMLIERGRIRVEADAVRFLEDTVQARSLKVMPISPRIAIVAQSDALGHGDPADRIIAATALVHRARLVSADARLRAMKGLKVIW